MKNMIANIASEAIHVIDSKMFPERVQKKNVVERARKRQNIYLYANLV